jgi:hypothetical protein
MERLEAQFHKDAYSLRSVQFWIPEIKRGREGLHDAQRSGRRPIQSLIAQIKVRYDENCFVSARSIAKTLRVSHSTGLKDLHEDSGFQSFHLRRVSHMLTSELKEQPRTYATETMVVLLSAQKDGWHHLVTGDESWFFLSYSPRRMWTLTQNYIASKPRREIRTAKFMLTIMWNPLGFHVTDKLPDSLAMNANYFLDNILSAFEEKCPRWKGGAWKATCRAYGQRSRSQSWDDNKFPCRSQYGATLAPAILAGSRFDRLLLISDSERKTKRYRDR